MEPDMNINTSTNSVAAVVRVSSLIISVLITCFLVMSNPHYPLWQTVGESGNLGCIRELPASSLFPYQYVPLSYSTANHYNARPFVHSLDPMSTISAISHALQCLQMGKRIAYSIKYCI